MSHDKAPGSLSKRSVFFWLRMIFAGIFIAASVDKIIHPEAFAKAIYNYQTLPDSAVNLTALILPWMELLVGCFLLFGIWLPGATVLANALLLAFFAALVFNLARGVNVHCGCFFTSSTGDASTSWYVLRDSLFLILGGSVFYDVFFREAGMKAICAREEQPTFG